MTGVQLFLMVFGAVMAVIGVIVFFLLAWFKEATGQEHHNAIKILQAEFRFSNPALVIFAGGMILMVVPFFLDQTMPGNSPPLAPQPTATARATVASPVAGPGSTPQTTTLGNSPGTGQVEVAAPRAEAPTPTFAPTPTPTPIPTATPAPVPEVTYPDPTGRWSNQNGYLEIQRVGVGEFVFLDFDIAGNQVGRGTASQDEDVLYIEGEGFIFDGLGNPYYVVYTGDFVLTGDRLEGDLYDSLGNYLGSVTFTRGSRGF